MTFTEQLKEAEELAGKLSIVHVFLSGSAAWFTRHAQTFCLLCTLKRIQVQNTRTMGKIEKIVYYWSVVIGILIQSAV